ncbi:hypothetical protein Hanom_Chr12g01167271 [Helianthus anomalus]
MVPKTKASLRSKRCRRHKPTAENKNFDAVQEARQMKSDIECLSKSIDHLQEDVLILAQMRRQQIRDKYGLSSFIFFTIGTE